MEMIETKYLQDCQRVGKQWDCKIWCKRSQHKPQPSADDRQRLMQRHIKGDRYQNGAKKIGKLAIKPNFSTG